MEHLSLLERIVIGVPALLVLYAAFKYPLKDDAVRESSRESLHGSLHAGERRDESPRS